jgi:hypothetical protein
MSKFEEESSEFKRFYPSKNVNKVNNIFDFYISNDESIIYKQNNNSNQRFSELLKVKKNRVDFGRILEGVFFESFIRDHISNGFDLESDGSHKMKFLHGYRLDLIRTYKIDTSTARLIIEQCEILLDKLEVVNENGIFFGDWATHNLVYSFEYGTIFNIDLEGFLTYNPVPKWADFKVCETWLKDVMSQLEGLISSEE